MKKSSVPVTPLVAAVAALVVTTGCNTQRQVRRCVDERGNVLPDSACTTGGYGAGYYGGIRAFGYPRWVYGGNVRNGQAFGFTSSPNPRATVVDGAGRTISRGGFGSSGRGFSGFGG